MCCCYYYYYYYYCAAAVATRCLITRPYWSAFNHGVIIVVLQIVRDYLSKKTFDVLITSYEAVLKEKSSLTKIFWQYVIMDEVSKLLMPAPSSSMP